MKTVLILIMIHTIVGGKTDEKKDEKKDKKEDKKAVVGSITCQNLDGGLAANPLLQVWNPKPLSLVCWDDDENGCENDDDGCLLPKKCEEYKDSFSYSTEGKEKGSSILNKRQDVTNLIQDQQDLCDIDEKKKKIADGAKKKLANLAI